MIKCKRVKPCFSCLSSGLCLAFQWMSFRETHCFPFPMIVFHFYKKLPSVILYQTFYILKSQCQCHHHNKVFTEKCAALQIKNLWEQLLIFIESNRKNTFSFVYLVTRTTFTKSFSCKSDEYFLFLGIWPDVLKWWKEY